MSSSRLLGPATDGQERRPPAKRLWEAFLDALLSLAALPPEPSALEWADVARTRQSVTR